MTDFIATMNDISNAIGKTYLSALLEVKEKMVSEGIPEAMAMASVRGAASGVLASMLAYTIVNGRGITDHDGRQAVVKKISRRLDELAKDIILEQGGQVVAVEAQKEPEDEPHEPT